MSLSQFAFQSALPMLFVVALNLACPASILAQGKGGGRGTTSPPELVYRNDDAIITLATADGEVVAELTGGNKGFTIMRTPTWSPDGSQIAYLEGTDLKEGGTIFDLYVMNVDGTGKTLMHQFENYLYITHPEHHDLKWLPGDYLSYRDAYSIAILDMIRGTSQRIDLNQWHDYFDQSSIGPGIDPTTPGSQGLLVYKAYDQGVTNGSDIHLAVLTADTDGALQFDPTTIRHLDLPGDQGFPVVSPDQTKVVFYDNATGGAGSIISTVSLDYSSGVEFGSVQELIVGTGFQEFRGFPTWSPDSQWVAFAWTKPDQKGERRWEIARLSSDGSAFINVTQSRSHEYAPEWIPIVPQQD